MRDIDVKIVQPISDVCPYDEDVCGAHTYKEVCVTEENLGFTAKIRYIKSGVGDSVLFTVVKPNGEEVKVGEAYTSDDDGKLVIVGMNTP